MKNSKNNNQGSRTMTEEEILQDSSLAHFHEAVRFMQKTPSKDIFPKKYEAAVIGVAMETVFELFEENPKMSLKMVLRGVIKHLPNDITPLLLSKVIQNALEEWTNLLADAKKESSLLIAA